MEYYESKGFRAAALKGGFDAWVQAGYPTAPKTVDEERGKAAA